MCGYPLGLRCGCEKKVKRQKVLKICLNNLITNNSTTDQYKINRHIPKFHNLHTKPK